MVECLHGHDVAYVEASRGYGKTASLLYCMRRDLQDAEQDGRRCVVYFATHTARDLEEARLHYRNDCASRSLPDADVAWCTPADLGRQLRSAEGHVLLYLDDADEYPSQLYDALNSFVLPYMEAALVNPAFSLKARFACRTLCYSPDESFTLASRVRVLNPKPKRHTCIMIVSAPDT